MTNYNVQMRKRVALDNSPLEGRDALRKYAVMHIFSQSGERTRGSRVAAGWL